MSVTSLLTQPDPRTSRDRLEVLTALINAPSFDPVFRTDIVTIPPDHPVFRWNCLITGCGRPTMGHGDLCSAHQKLWRRQRDAGTSRAQFLRTATPAGPGQELEERACRICPARPARHLTLELCHHHQFRWYHHRNGHQDRYGAAADFDDWLVDQQAARGYGDCLVTVCPDRTHSPLELCYRHVRHYRNQGGPGGAVLPRQWSNRFERTGRLTPVEYADDTENEEWR